MQQTTSFTKHGALRTKQRSNLSPSIVASYIDNGFAVNLGRQIGTTKVHWLFYSAEDSQFYVAVRTSESAMIVTLLPLEYHGNYGIKVTPDHKSQAEKKAGELNSRLSGESTQGEERVKVVVRYFNEEQKLKTKTALKGAEARMFPELRHGVRGAKRFERLVEYYLQLQNISTERVLDVVIYFEHQNSPRIVEWSDPAFLRVAA